MSKGNLFMGFGRGKVGSVVLSRSKGQQVARAYNEAPKNPRSEGQMLQRSIFASAVKFYTQGRQAFYQFAFENKSSKQSDYNAFASVNAKRGMNISKNAFDESTYPVLAPWQMSKGSLPELELAYVSADKNFKLSVPGIVASSNWGAISTVLKDVYALNGGDIITVVTINANGSDANNTPAVDPEKRQMIRWDIKQLVIDVESTAAVTDLFGAGAAAVTDGITFTGATTTTNAGAACVTISRVTDEGLKVNDSYLILNAVAETIYTASKEQGYIDKVLSSWNASGKAILEGALVPNQGSAPAPVFTSVKGAATNPSSLASIPSTEIGETVYESYSQKLANYVNVYGSNLTGITLNDLRAEGASAVVNYVTVGEGFITVKFTPATEVDDGCDIFYKETKLFNVIP